MSEKFTEYSETGEDILRIIETVLIGIGEKYEIHYGMPAHDVARRFLNEIYEFESERAQESRVVVQWLKGVKENAD